MENWQWKGLVDGPGSPAAMEALAAVLSAKRQAFAEAVRDQCATYAAEPMALPWLLADGGDHDA